MNTSPSLHETQPQCEPRGRPRRRLVAQLLLLAALLACGTVATLVEAANALTDVKLQSGNPCGTGRMQVLVNRNTGRTISVTVKTSTVYRGKLRSETKVYRLSPGGEKQVGCSSIRHQAFKRRIVGAEYASP